MPTNVADFADDTAFERYVLDIATPLVPRSESSAVIELGDGSTSVAVTPAPVKIHVSVSDSVGSAPTGLSTGDLRPLLFGAYSHVTWDEVEATPDSVRREGLLQVLREIGTRIPAGGVVVGYSRFGEARFSATSDFHDSFGGRNPNHTHDAMHAHTAHVENCELITPELRRMRNVATALGVTVVHPLDLLRAIGWSPT